MSAEEFYRTQWTYPEKMDEYYKAGLRFSYNDMLKFATDYHALMVNKLNERNSVDEGEILCEHFWIDAQTPDLYECTKCGKQTNDYEQSI